MGAQPVIEVAAEGPAPLLLRQVLMGGDDDPGLEPLGQVAAEREIFPLLQQPQQLDLGGDAEVADLVQEQGAVGRLLHHAAPDLLGTGKGAPHMAEEGIGKDRVIQTGHVDRHQLAAAAAQAVGGLGDQLLADPALAGDQQRLGAFGHRLHVGKDRQHRPVTGDDGGRRPRDAAVRRRPGGWTSPGSRAASPASGRPAALRPRCGPLHRS